MPHTEFSLVNILKNSTEGAYNHERSFFKKLYDIDLIIDDCCKLNTTLANQYFYELISNLQSNDMYLNDDIYILEEILKIRKFLNANSIDISKLKFD